MSYLGYGIVTKDQISSVYNTLKQFGCHQIITDDLDSTHKSQSQLKKALSQLQSNDILVISRIDQLSPSTNSLISHLNTLSEKKIHLQILEDDLLICWNNYCGTILLQILTKFQEQKNQTLAKARKKTLISTGKTTGRPSIIDSDKRELVETLFSAGYPTTKICQQAGISRTTFHNHFSYLKKKNQPLTSSST